MPWRALVQMEQTRILMDFPEFAECSSDRIKTCPGPSQLSLLVTTDFVRGITARNSARPISYWTFEPA
jgi:hypothetical protein